jgi:hypothetical protein
MDRAAAVDVLNFLILYKNNVSPRIKADFKDI